MMQLTSESMVEGQRPPNVCPLCGFTPKGNEPRVLDTSTEPQLSAVPKKQTDTPLGMMMAKRARIVTFNDKLLSTEPSTEPSGDSDCLESLECHDDVDPELESLVPVSQAMETHITGHLQFLMLLSLKLIETQNEESDTVSQSGSMTPMESASGCHAGSRGSWEMEDMPSPPVSTPSRSSGSGLPEDWDFLGSDPPTVSEHSGSDHVSPAIQVSSDPILQHLCHQQLPRMDDLEEPDVTTGVEGSAPLIDDGGSERPRPRMQNAYFQDKPSASGRHFWGEWSEWIWGEDEQRMWRARQDIYGMLSGLILFPSKRHYLVQC